MKIDPKMLAQAMDDIAIYPNSRWRVDKRTKPTIWYVVDESRAEWEVNYPGDLCSQHNSYEAAKIGRAEAILEKIEKLQEGKLCQSK